MENNTVKMEEIEEIESINDDIVECPVECSNNGAFFAGIVGGFAAYAFVSGAKKLVTFIGTKVAEHKAKKGNKHDIIDAEISEDQ